MCTLTWRDRGGLEVFFNRDELKTRSRATPPRLYETKGGTRYLAPIDPDAGGTWMLANQHRLVICLLNRWHAENGHGHHKSRGLIVTELADCESLAALEKTLSNKCQGAKPFDLVSFSPGQIAAFAWNGKILTSFSPEMPLTSSSFYFEEVKAARLKSFQKSATLEHFQNPPSAPPSPFTVRMNRPDAQTWSRSQLKVDEAGILWNYWEEFPDLSQDPKLHRSELKIS